MAIDLDDRGQSLESEYFQRQEGDLLAKMKARFDAEKATDIAIKCPKCDGKLIETDFQNIKINVCDQCSGVWFDAGEFVHIATEETDGGWFGKLFR